MNPLLRTILQRLGFGLITLFVVSVVLSLLVGVLPGDFATRTLGQAATPDTVAAFRREIGLDRPPVGRYLHWLGDMEETMEETGNIRRAESCLFWPICCVLLPMSILCSGRLLSPRLLGKSLGRRRLRHT